MTRRIRYDAWPAAAGSVRRRSDTERVWTSPWCEPGFAVEELVASWHATTPGRSHVEISAQGDHSRAWHSWGRWSSGSSGRSSVSDDPEVVVDVWRPAPPTTRYRLRVTLHDVARSQPTLVTLGAVASAGRVRTDTSRPRGTARVIDVPRLSQLSFRDVGGREWCSPTSVSMVLAHAGRLPPATDIPTAARATHDTAYDGTGNWSFNTAWAAGLTGHAFVTRLHDLREAEAFIEAGVPLVASVAYGPGALRGAPTRATDGHLVVIRGFTAEGDVVTNDPAAGTERSVRRTYDRGQFERAWLDGSGGTVYVIHEDHTALPPRGRSRAW